jgi:hypothetical protein
VHPVLGMLDAHTGALLNYDLPKYARINEAA